MSKRCQCGAAIIRNAAGTRICCECQQTPSKCSCRKLVRGWDPNLPEMEELEHQLQDGSMADLAECASRLNVPRGYLMLAMRDADWSEEAIRDVVEEACGWNPRIDDEQRHDRTESPTWGETRETMTSKKRKAQTTSPPSVDEAGEMVARPPAPRGGAEPRATWIGIPIYNPAAAYIIEKVMNDMGDGKLDMTNHDDRMEMVQWTDLILKQEQIYGQTGYILRNITSRANFSSLLSKLLGRAASEVSGEPRRVAARAEF